MKRVILNEIYGVGGGDDDDGGGGGVGFGGGITWNSWNYRHVQVCRIKAMCDQNNIYDHTVFRS